MAGEAAGHRRPRALTAGMSDSTAKSQGDTFKQAGRLLGIDSVLGPDLLLLTELTGEEALSTLFEFDVAMISRDLDIAPERLVGSRVTIWIRRTDGERTPINGYVRRFRAGRLLTREFREYRAEVVPWLWFLSRTTDSRIFQDKSVPKVVEAVFQEFGFTDFDMSGMLESYPTLDYVVQYRETALDFVCRWMEEVGIHFHFQHEEKKHTLVLGDHNVRFAAAAEASVGYGNPHQDEISEWQHDYNYRSGTWSQKDFNFETPQAALLTTQKSLLKLPNIGSFERFDYPGRYAAMQPGDILTRIRVEEDEAAYHTVSGASGCASFRSGLKFKLDVHPLESEKGRSYVLLRVRHHALQPNALNKGEGESYSNEFVAFPVDTRFRPPRVAARPFVHGPQTAIVVGPPGETIHTDKYGRVKLQFHWDRQGKRDDKSSCWVRVSQPWGGGGWGGVFIPHVGHEVVVSFLEGDPDRPLVTGRVYNAGSMQAVGLPANKTQSAWRDHTGNEIQMEGKGGSQDIRVTAVKDMNVTVQHDYNDKIKTGNRSIEVATGTHTETIKGDTKITITTGALTIAVTANTATYQSKATTTVNSTSADVHVQAKTQIALDVGGSHLLMKADGTISLDGKNITIHGSESVSIKGNAIRSIADQEHESKGAITVSEGVTTNTVKGGMVMLNPGT